MASRQDGALAPRVVDRFCPEAVDPGHGRRPIAPPPCAPSAPRSAIVGTERRWRLPDIPGGNRPHPRLFAARWRGANRQEQASEITGDHHMLSIALQPSKFSLRLGSAWFPNTEVVPGTIQLTRPALPARIVYHAPYDVLHLYIQNALLREYVEWSQGAPARADIAIRDPRFAHDPMFEQLGMALLSADQIGGPYGALYADSLSLAIVARLFALYGEQPASRRQQPAGGLPAWRLKRVIDFIEDHADGPITLADLADAVGLSRMHFAAQFRKATGLRPHEYLLRRRIEKAKALLAAGSTPIAQVALSVGFGSQAHFTGVFKRFTGLTPGRWREQSGR